MISETDQPKNPSEVLSLLNQFQNSLAVTPRGPQLAQSIENIRTKTMLILEKWSVDAQAALANFARQNPEYTAEAELKVASLCAEVHSAIKNVIDTANDRSMDIRASVDSKRFINDLALFLKVSSSSDTEPKTLGISAPSGMNFVELVIGGDIEKRKSIENIIIDNINEADIQKLLLDVMSEKSSDARADYMARILEEICERESQKTGKGKAKVNGMKDKLIAFIDQIKMGRNPYILRTSDHAILGVLAEAIAPTKESWNTWKQTRGLKQRPNGTAIPQYSPETGRHQELQGRLVMHGGTGIIEDIRIENDKVAETGKSADEVVFANIEQEDVAHRAAGIYFVDGEELMDTLTYLPVGHSSALSMRIHKTDIVCDIYRDENGELIIEDEHGQRPSPLRNVKNEDILKDPLTYFSVREMKIKYPQK
jgi:hypothetical protein